jgi:hypothetical protein
MQAPQQGRDIYTRPQTIDVDVLANLGPLRALAGVWRGTNGLDVHPSAAGEGVEPFEETIELQPIDPQTNGPQLLYGLRYVSRMTKPGEVGTYHGQVGYWLWEPATGLLVHSFTIPRGQVVLATGRASADATEFEVTAGADAIRSIDFLQSAFRTDSFGMTVTVAADGSWSYFQDTVMQVEGRPGPFHHTDRNRLVRVAAPTPNPLAGG